MTTLDQVSVGAVFAWAARATANDPVTGIDLTLFTRDRSVAGQIHLAVDGTISGSTSVPLSQIQITVVSQPFTVGDIVVSTATGETMVVRDTWVDTEGPQWSNTTSRRTAYSTKGWNRVGVATLT